MIERWRDRRPRWVSWLRVIAHAGRLPGAAAEPRARREAVFRAIYRRNRWRDAESRSGSGANLRATEIVRRELPRLVAELGVTTLLDVPCGDFHWMKEIDLPVERYVGGDIVADLVAENARAYGDARRSFQVLDLTCDPLPRAELVLCRDGMPHLSHADVLAALRNIRASGARWLLATTYRGAERDNPDIVTGDWRPLDLERPPFRLAAPELLLPEPLEESGYDDKFLGLWPTSALPGGA
jgi:hypothetical protein